MSFYFSENITTNCYTATVCAVLKSRRLGGCLKLPQYFHFSCSTPRKIRLQRNKSNHYLFNYVWQTHKTQWT